MTDILKELFASPFYSDCNPSEELKALRHQEAALWDKVLPILGLDTIDEINNIQGEIAHEVELKWFRRGVQLGAAVMLELIK